MKELNYTLTKGSDEILVSYFSPVSHRLFTFSEGLPLVDDSMERLDKKEKLRLAKVEIEKKIAEIIKKEEELSEYFSSKMKKVGLGLTDVSRMSLAEVENLSNLIDVDLLVFTARSMGVVLESTPRTTEQIKKALILLLEKEPELDFGYFLQSKSVKDNAPKDYFGHKLSNRYPRASNARAGLTLTIDKNKEESGDIVAISPNKMGILLKTGEFVGQRFTNRKVEQYVKEVADDIKNSTTKDEFIQLVKVLTTYSDGSFSDRVSSWELSRKIEELFLKETVAAFENSDNEDLRSFSYRAISFARDAVLSSFGIEVSDRYDDSSLPEAVVGSAYSLIDGNNGVLTSSEEDLKSVLKKYIDGVFGIFEKTDLSDYFGDRGIFKALKAQAIEVANKAVTEEKKFLVSIKNTVLSRIAEKGSPVTEGRIKKQVREILAENKTSGRDFYLIGASRDFLDIFENELITQSELPPVAKKEAPYSAKRIKKPESAVDDYFLREGLSVSDRQILLNLIFSSNAGVREFSKYSEMKEVPEFTVSDIGAYLKASGEKLLTYLKSNSPGRGYRDDLRPLQALVNEALLAIGMEEKVDWTTVHSVNAEKLIDSAPDSALINYVRYSFKLTGSLAAKVLDRLGTVENFIKVSKGSEAKVEDIVHLVASMREHGGLDAIAKFLSKNRNAARDLRCFDIMRLAQSGEISSEDVEFVKTSAPIMAIWLAVKASRLGMKGVVKELIDAAIYAEKLVDGSSRSGQRSNQGELPWEVLEANFSESRYHRSGTLEEKIFAGSNLSDGEMANFLLTRILTKNLNLEQLNVKDAEKAFEELIAGSGKSKEEALHIVREGLTHGSAIHAKLYSVYGSGISVDEVLSVVGKKKEEASAQFEKATESFNKGKSRFDSYYEQREAEVAYAQYEKTFVLPEHQLKYFNDIAKVHKEFVNLANILAIDDETAVNCSEGTALIAARLIPKVLAKFKHHAHLSGFENFCRLFTAHHEPSFYIVNQANFTPSQAVIAANKMEVEAVKLGVDHLMDVASRSEASLIELSAVLLARGIDVTISNKNKSKLHSSPEYLSAKALSDISSLSIKDWNLLISSPSDLSSLILGLLQKGKDKDLQDIFEIAESSTDLNSAGKLSLPTVISQLTQKGLDKEFAAFFRNMPESWGESASEFSESLIDSISHGISYSKKISPQSAAVILRSFASKTRFSIGSLVSLFLASYLEHSFSDEASETVADLVKSCSATTQASTYLSKVIEIESGKSEEEDYWAVKRVEKAGIIMKMIG